MRAYVIKDANGTVHPILGSLAARWQYRTNRDKIGFRIGVATFLYFVSPFFFLMMIISMSLIYYREIHSYFFYNSAVHGKYKELLRPVASSDSYAIIGYRVYPEELETHLSIINDDSSNGIRELGKKGKQFKGLEHRQFTFSIDKITRHIGFFGTTGAGKSETIMSFIGSVLDSYGSIGFIDGKGDLPMGVKLYNICKEKYYETQFYSIVLNMPEANAESNTYNPLLSYGSAMKASEFLGEFITSGGGDGNADYFANRAKVMLGNIVQQYKNRQTYYGENFSISDLAFAINPLEINNIYYMAYGCIMDIEDLITETIKKDPVFASIIERAHGVKTAQVEYIKNTELLYTYLSQNSHLTRVVEHSLGVRYNFISDQYTLFSSIQLYIKGISTTWGSNAHTVAMGMYLVLTKQNRGFIYSDDIPVAMDEIRRTYEKMKVRDKEVVKLLENDRELDANVLAAIGINASGESNESDAENVEYINPDNMRQHQYAEQQWGRIFDLFKTYSHIYGTPTPEVDGKDILSNNKVLRVSIVPMELSSDQTEAIGKIHILMFKNTAALAVGGDKQSATPIQFQIHQNKIKPNPIHIMFMDEIGSYIVPGMSVLLSQVRSLRIGIVLSGQDLVSMKPGESDKELSRNIANMGKIVFQSRDADTIEMIEKALHDMEVLESDGLLHSAVGKKILETGSVSLKTIKPFDPKVTSSFGKGFGLYLDGATTEPIFFQSYYLGDNSRYPLQIRRFDSFDNVKKSA